MQPEEYREYRSWQIDKHFDGIQPHVLVSILSTAILSMITNMHKRFANDSGAPYYCSDLHGAWDEVTGMNAPLYYQGYGDEQFNIHTCVENYAALGVPRERISE